MRLYDQISHILHRPLCESENTYTGFRKRLVGNALTRDENPQSHFCVYFLPFDRQSNKAFIVHHKKSGLWLSPGGHIDRGEGLLDTLNREIDEELGVKQFFQNVPSPFLLTITPIENTVQPCKVHFDIWYLVETDGSNFIIDPREFHDTKWLTISEAETVVTDPPNRKALEILKKRYENRENPRERGARVLGR